MGQPPPHQPPTSNGCCANEYCKYICVCVHQWIWKDPQNAHRLLSVGHGLSLIGAPLSYMLHILKSLKNVKIIYNCGGMFVSYCQWNIWPCFARLATDTKTKTHRLTLLEILNELHSQTIASLLSPFRSQDLVQSKPYKHSLYGKLDIICYNGKHVYGRRWGGGEVPIEGFQQILEQQGEERT